MKTALTGLIYFCLNRAEEPPYYLPNSLSWRLCMTSGRHPVAPRALTCRVDERKLLVKNREKGLRDAAKAAREF
jgi:hypothetical protein